MAITNVSTCSYRSPFDEGFLALSQIPSQLVIAIQRTEVIPDTINGRFAI